MEIKIKAYNKNTKKMEVVTILFTTFVLASNTNDYVINNWSISLV